MFKIYSATTLEALAEQFSTEVLGNRPPVLDLQPVTVVNQTRGVADWLRMFLARRDSNGIAMNLDMQLPAQFVRKTLNSIFQLEPHAMPDDNSDKWRIFRELVENPAGYKELRSFLGNGDSGGSDATDRMVKAWQLSGKVADLFDRYQLVWHPLIKRWRSVSDPEALRDSNENERWMCRLFRNCFPDGSRCYSEYLHKFIEDTTIYPAGDTAQNPATVNVFGVGAMRSAWFRFFHELGRRGFCHVNFFYLMPSREYISDQKSHREIRNDEEEVEGNRILQNNIRQGRLFFNTLLDTCPDFGYDGSEEPAENSAPALERLQSEIRSLTDRSAGELAPFTIAAEDDSIAIHSCHSMRRQVEVLHDQLLRAFSADPTLLPSDVLVMAPDIDAFAPYIHSVFSEHPNLAWRISICDRAPIASSAILTSFIAILESISGQCTAEEILALLEHPAIQKRRSITHASLPTIRQWVKQAGICWGTDAEHHEEVVNCKFREFSWQYGLQRIMMGLARTASDDLDEDGIAQLNMENASTELLFAFSSFVNDFMDLRREILDSHTFEEWRDILCRAADTFVTGGAQDSESQNESNALRLAINTLTQSAQKCQFEHTATLPLIIEMLREYFSAPANSHNFISDKMTFCAMRPMRSIPKRIIALLGMNEGAFPKTSRNLGFDLSKSLTTPNDIPEPEDKYTSTHEERYLFLETIFAAREKLWFFYDGCKSFNEEKLQCAPPLAELIEYMDAEKHIINHDRHAFSEKYFCAEGALAGKSVNSRAFDIAKQLRNPPIHDNKIQPLENDAVEVPDIIKLNDIDSCLAAPCNAFLKLHCSLNYDKTYSEEIPTKEIAPETYDNLQKISLAQMLIDGKGQRFIAANCLLPPIDTLQRQTLEKFNSRAPQYYREAVMEQLDVRIRLKENDDDSGREITIRHNILCTAAPDGHRHFFLLIFSASDKWKSMVRVQLNRIFLQAALADGDKATLHILQWDYKQCGFAEKSEEIANSGDDHLLKILNIYVEAQRKPLPFFAETTKEAAKAIAKGKEPDINTLIEIFSAQSYDKKKSSNDSTDPAVVACGFTVDNIEIHIRNMVTQLKVIYGCETPQEEDSHDDS